MNKLLQQIIEFSLKTGFNVKNLSFSPITGGEGNIEFLLHLHWMGETEEDHSSGINELTISPNEIVKSAHLRI